MKKFVTLAVCTALALGLAGSLAACGRADADPYTITVGASATPHAEILNVVKEELAEYGYTLSVRTFDDYILPNLALDSGELDANYFQHTPYLNTFNADHGTRLSAVAKIHYEPFGVYGKNVSAEEYSATKTGRTILVPNDGSNLTRALFVLRDEGYLDLPADADPEVNLTVNDIADLHGNKVQAILAETVAAQLAESKDGTLAVINGNYALQAGLRSADALAFESATGDAAQLYANIIAVREGSEEHPKIKALLKALRSQKVYDFITSTYGGAVLPVFTAQQ